MGNKVCGSKREDTVIVYDERDRPRRVSASEYAHIKAAEQRKLQNMGYDCAPPAGSYAQGPRRSGVRDEVPVEPIPEYVVDYGRDQAQLRGSWSEISSSSARWRRGTSRRRVA